METADPLLSALPPATDYISYATIVEQHLSRDNLPILLRVLQDEKLTVNIGWDLVHLLLPLLPDSEACLSTVARLGNPREVLLKATESLRLIDFDSAEATSNADTEADDGTPRSPAGGDTARMDLPIAQFRLLLKLLTVLHSRIKTKYPSRFLSTSLAAVLGTLNGLGASQIGDILSDVLLFVRGFLADLKPALPPRNGSSALSNQAVNASDPEASKEAPPTTDDAIFRKLLMSFLTHLAELYVLSLGGGGDVVGLCLADQVQEQSGSTKIVPGRETVADKLVKNKALISRRRNAQNLLSLAHRLGLPTSTLFHVASATAEARPRIFDLYDEDEPPQIADDVPLSKCGAMCLFAIALSDGRTGDARVHIDSARDMTSDFNIFPEHDAMLRNLDEADEGQMTSMSHGVLDALLALGLGALEECRIGRPNDNEHFNTYLMRISLISAQCSSPSLRYHAHCLTTRVLRSHPDPNARLAFMKDTLEHCPIDNLKPAAVGWIKGEILEANPPPETERSSEVDPSIFSSPVALDLLAEYLFPDLSVELASPSTDELWTTFKTNLAFWLASLNFYYLLLTAKHLCEKLKIKTLHSSHDVGGSFMSPLRECSMRLQASLKNGELLGMEGEAGVELGKADAMLLTATLERVDQAVLELNCG